MKLKESDVRQRLNHMLAVLRPETPWHIDRFLAQALAILYPLVRYNEVESVEKLKVAVHFIKTIRAKKEEAALLDSLNKDSLVKSLQDRWISKIENKIELSSSFAIFDYIDDDNNVVFREKLFEAFRNGNIPILESKYGTRDYNTVINEETLCSIESDTEKNFDLYG